MADTSKDGLLLGGGIRHITATQAEVKVPACIRNIVLTRKFSAIFRLLACAKEYLIAVTC